MEEDILMEEGRRYSNKQSTDIDSTYIQNDIQRDFQRDFQQNDIQSDITLDEDIDSEIEEYLQNDFQDDLVNKIFEDIKNYINDQAVPLCEYLTHDDIEEIINLFLL